MGGLGARAKDIDRVFQKSDDFIRFDNDVLVRHNVAKPIGIEISVMRFLARWIAEKLAYHRMKWIGVAE